MARSRSPPGTQAVLFDLDDTLFDHRNSARAALLDVHRAHAAQIEFARLEQSHSHPPHILHLEGLAGRLSIDDARRERFRRIFADAGVSLDDGLVETIAAAY